MRALTPRRVVGFGRRGGGRNELAILVAAYAGKRRRGRGDGKITVNEDYADNVVAVRSKEYYARFLSQRSVDKPKERVTSRRFHLALGHAD